MSGRQQHSLARMRQQITFTEANFMDTNLTTLSRMWRACLEHAECTPCLARTKFNEFALAVARMSIEQPDARVADAPPPPDPLDAEADAALRGENE